MIRHQQNAVLLPRLLGLRDASPFILIIDSALQSGSYLLLEFLHRIPASSNVVCLLFDSICAPSRCNVSIDCFGLPLEEVHKKVHSSLKPAGTSSSGPIGAPRNVVIIDSLTHIPNEQYAKFLIPLMAPGTVLVATMHADVPHSHFSGSLQTPYYPSPETLLSYFATSILSVGPMPSGDINKDEDLARNVSDLVFPVDSSNCTRFSVVLTHRRRSGRSLDAEYIVDYNTHAIDYVAQPLSRRNTLDGFDGMDAESGSAMGSKNAEEELLRGLTTFNLTTTNKQKEQRDKVELPFLQAQELGEGGARGGAIIYEFEKEDDYDEEDPYEDPF